MHDSHSPLPARDTPPAGRGPRKGGLKRLLGVTTLIKLAGMGLTLLSSIVLARVLGASEYGAFAFASTLLTALAIPGAMGTERLTVRSIARYLAQGHKALAYGSYRWGNRSVAISSLLCAAVGLAALLAISGGLPDDSMGRAALLALALVPLFSLTKQRQATLRGLHRVASGLFPELVLRPALHVLMIGGLWWAMAQALDAVSAIALLGAAALASYIVGNAILRPHLRREFAGVEPQYDARAWLRAAFPFALLAGIYVLHQKVDVLLLAWLATPADVGVFHVVSRCTDAMLLFYNALQAGLAPSAARLYALDDKRQLQSLVHRSNAVVCGLTAAAALVLIAGGPWILRLFGPEFAAGYWALVILAVGQLVHVGLGPAGMLLNMAGQERVTLAALALSVALNTGLNLILVPRMGVTGAALATGAALVALALGLAVAAKRRTGISSTLLRFI